MRRLLALQKDQKTTSAPDFISIADQVQMWLPELVQTVARPEQQISKNENHSRLPQDLLKEALREEAERKEVLNDLADKVT